MPRPSSDIIVGMPEDGKGEVTQLLDRWAHGDRAAFETMAGVVHRELRQIAEAYLRRERPGHTLQPTALVNEAWLRLVRQDPVSIHNRKHFFALAAHIMRNVLAAHARTRHAAKRGGERPANPVECGAGNLCAFEDFLNLDEALNRLSSQRPRVAEILELRYFGGLTVEEIASQLKVSVSTVVRNLRSAEAWLRANWR